MKLFKHEDGTVSLRCSEETMRKVICMAGYVLDPELANIGAGVDWDSNLHPDNCVDVLKQQVAEVDITKDGNIEVFCDFVVNKDEL